MSDMLSRDVALRIGLAARELEDTDAARLLKVLADAVGLPPEEAALEKLSVKQLKTAADGELSSQTPDNLKRACALLKGEQQSAADLPEAEAYEDGDMPDSLRIACAANSGELINGHFGSCPYFLIYQLSADQLRLVDVRHIDAALEKDDKNAYRAELIGDCQVLFVASIGGPAAAKVIKAGVHPIKDQQGGSAREKLQALQGKIASAPPPWLAKAMGHAAEERVRFETTELEEG